jgi:glucan phosphoethanolaminetransferase (alkaline phosphatase superfamily)
MLQRKQSLWMLLAAACAVLTIKLPFYTGPTMDAAQGKVVEKITASSNIPLLILTVLLVVVMLVNIFNYKNRKLQLRITIGLILVSLLDIFLFYQASMKTIIGGTFALTSVLALAIPLLLIMSARGIFKDQKLIKSADRLR